MMLHCPVCGELCDFQLRTRIDFDPDEGWIDENYAVCDHCLTPIDAADLDRQAELEKNDERKSDR